MSSTIQGTGAKQFVDKSVALSVSGLRQRQVSFLL